MLLSAMSVFNCLSCAAAASAAACLPAHAEHLGEHSTYTLPQYLAMGQCDGGLSAEQIFAVISNAIFVNRVSTYTGSLTRS
jgi:hypothetical protein